WKRGAAARTACARSDHRATLRRCCGGFADRMLACSAASSPSNAAPAPQARELADPRAAPQGSRQGVPRIVDEYVLDAIAALDAPRNRLTRSVRDWIIKQPFP